MLTRPHPRGGATSITRDNLKANLWTELANWRAKSELLQAAFEQTKSEIFARDHPQTWKLEARTWAQGATREQIGQALAGLHAPYVLWLMDESEIARMQCAEFVHIRPVGIVPAPSSERPRGRLPALKP